MKKVLSLVIIFSFVISLFLSWFVSSASAAATCKFEVTPNPITATTKTIGLTITPSKDDLSDGEYWIMMNGQPIGTHTDNGTARGVFLDPKSFSYKNGGTISVADLTADRYFASGPEYGGTFPEGGKYFFTVTIAGTTSPLCTSGGFEVSGKTSGRCRIDAQAIPFDTPAPTTPPGITPPPGSDPRNITTETDTLWIQSKDIPPGNTATLYIKNENNENIINGTKISVAELKGKGVPISRKFPKGAYTIELRSAELTLGIPSDLHFLCSQFFTVVRPGEDGGGTAERNPFSLSTYLDPLCEKASPGDMKNFVCKTAIGDINNNFPDFIKKIFAVLLSLSGGIAVLLIVMSGYKLITSSGNPEKTQEARERLTSAIVGLLFIIFSFVILEVIGVSILRLPGFGH